MKSKYRFRYIFISHKSYDEGADVFKHSDMIVIDHSEKRIRDEEQNEHRVLCVHNKGFVHIREHASII